jgi:hypothetical protein
MSMRRANQPGPEPAQRTKLKKDRSMANDSQNGTSSLQLILAWGFVGIPLAWGVLQTLQNAMKLFQ